MKSSELSVNEWHNLFKRYEQSGTTKKKFCLANRINRDSFYYWSKKLRPDLVGTTPSSRESKLFLPIKYESKEQSFKITLESGLSIEFQSTVSNLRNILQELKVTNEVVQ